MCFFLRLTRYVHGNCVLLVNANTHNNCYIVFGIYFCCFFWGFPSIFRLYLVNIANRICRYETYKLELFFYLLCHLFDLYAVIVLKECFPRPGHLPLPTLGIHWAHNFIESGLYWDVTQSFLFLGFQRHMTKWVSFIYSSSSYGQMSQRIICILSGW